MAGCHDLIHALFELLIVHTVVVQVHELEETKALFRVPLQHKFDDLFSHFRYWDVAGETESSLSYFLLCLLLVLTPEGKRAVEHGIEHEADRPDVHRRARHCIALEHLRRHVGNGACVHGVRLESCADACDSEIDYLDGQVFYVFEQDVF